jgi:hypothetical protein
MVRNFARGENKFWGIPLSPVCAGNIFTGVDCGLNRGSSVRRPRSEDPIRAQVILLYIIGQKHDGSLPFEIKILVYHFTLYKKR